MEYSLTIETRGNNLRTLPPKRPDETQTAWEDPWAAAASARRDLGPGTPYGAEDLNARAVGHAITAAINADPAEVARLRKARQEAREGKTRPWRDRDTR
jgi:hypothetical protein